jgi:hypothetical protein
MSRITPFYKQNAMTNTKLLYDDFERICLGQLHLVLKTLGFIIIKKEKDALGVFITFQNPTTAVRVSFEPREGGIFVLVTRLVDGKIPAYPLFIGPDTVIHSFYLDDLVRVKAPGFQFGFTKQEFSTPAQIESALAEVAEQLEDYADDVTRGDFEIFNELDRVVKIRQSQLAKQQARSS